MSNPFSLLRDWWERWKILQEARRQEGDRDEQPQITVRDELNFAIMALENGDRGGAMATWTKLMADHPAMARASPPALRLLIRLERYEEAEEIMRAGQKKHPNDPFFAQGLAEIAHAKRDFDTAIERWAFLRKRFPGVAEGYTYGANALLQKDLLEPAEALALQAMDPFPDRLIGAWEYANVAVKRQDWNEALRRWKSMQGKFRFSAAPVGVAQALSHLGRHEEAEEEIKRARRDFGDEVGLHYEFARIAEAKGDITESIERWKAVVARFPLDMNVHFIASEALEKLGELGEAEATLRAIVDRFPTEPRAIIYLAKYFHFKTLDFPAAVTAWAHLREVSPDFEEAYTFGADALRRCGRTEEATALLEAKKSRFNVAAPG